MREKVKNIIFDIINQNYSNLEFSEFSLLKNLPFEEIDYVEIVIKFEEDFDVILDEFKIEKMENLKEIIDYINCEILAKNN